MATAIQRRGGSTADHANFTGLAREITIDTDKNTVVVHDGSTAGGIPLATEAALANVTTSVGNIVADITSVIAGNGLTGGASSGDANLNVGAGYGITVSSDAVSISNTDVRALFSATDAGGDGSFSYSNGVFTYNGPSQAEANARMDAYLVGGGGITYTSGTIAVGAGTGITVNDDNVAINTGTIRGLFSAVDNGGDGSFTYDNSTGAFSYTGPSQSDIRSHFSAGTGVTITNGQISIGQAVGTSDNVSFADLTLSGNLTVNGTTTTINSTTVTVDDAFFRVNADGADIDAGFEANVGGSVKQITYDTSESEWTFGGVPVKTTGGFRGNLTGDVTGNLTGDVTGNLTGNVTGTVSSLANHTTTNLTEGTNLYFTTARANTAMNNYLVGGNGLTYGSGTFAVGAGTGITVNADDVSLSTSGVAAGTYGSATAVGQIVVDTYGRVTSASNVSISPAVGSLTGLGTGVATFLATPSSANLKSAVTDETGSGALVFATSPSLTTPTLGVASATSINKVAFTAPATSATLGLADGSTLATNGAYAITLTATAASNVTLPTSGTLATLSGTETLSNKTFVAPALGTPASGTLTNCTGLPISAGISGLGSGVATFLATPSSANLASAVTDETGSGALVFGTSPTFTTQITTPVIVKSGTDGTGDIGQSNNKFATIYATTFSGTATAAKYADLAERYEADAILEPGTVVCFGGEKEITACDHPNDHAVAGVISTDPAYMMNSDAGNDATHPYVALTGRVPVKVTGEVNKGDLLVSSGVKGYAMANNNAKAGTIIGKAIGSNLSGEAVIEALINMM